jgi:uridine kinase
MDDETAGKPVLVPTAGPSGTGMSALARAIGSMFGWLVIDKDVIVTSHNWVIPRDGPALRFG